MYETKILRFELFYAKFTSLTVTKTVSIMFDMNKMYTYTIYKEIIDIHEHALNL